MNRRVATIDFQASLAAQSARCREILDRLAEENRSAELLRRLRPWTRTHRPGAPRDDTPPPAREQSSRFLGHRCVRCGDGEKPCVRGHPNGCEWPQARND